MTDVVADVQIIADAGRIHFFAKRPDGTTYGFPMTLSESFPSRHKLFDIAGLMVGNFEEHGIHTDHDQIESLIESLDDPA